MKNQFKLTNVQDLPMIVYEDFDIISNEIIKNKNFYEFEIFNKWKSYFPSDGLMLDIGANIGNHSLMFHKYFPNLNIWSFEIHYVNFTFLRKNTELYPKIKCFNVGVGSCNGIVHYGNGPEFNKGGVTISPDGQNVNFVLSLDSFSFPEPVKFIKIDIEQHEFSAFQGMTNMLKKDKPIIWLEDFNGIASEYLFNLGYQIIDVEENTHNYLMTNKF
jgi:FkbM family methyltransferase